MTASHRGRYRGADGSRSPHPAQTRLWRQRNKDAHPHSDRNTRAVSEFTSIHFTQCPFLTKHLFPKLVLLKRSSWRQRAKCTITKRRGKKSNLFCVRLRSECLLFGHSSAGRNRRENLPSDPPAGLYTINSTVFGRFQELVCDESSNLLLCVLAFPLLSVL